MHTTRIGGQTYGFYIPLGWDPVYIKTKLGRIAKALGYVTPVGKAKGEGSVGDLLVAIVTGEAVVIPRGDLKRDGERIYIEREEGKMYGDTPAGVSGR